MRNSGKPSEIELKRRKKLKTNGKFWGEIQEANCDGQIDQLEAFRFEMQSVHRNLARGGSGEILENEMHGMGEEIPKGETYNKYGEGAGE